MFMKTSKAARRYARAIFQLAVEKKAEADVRADFQALATLLRESPEFANLVHDPAHHVHQQQEALQKLFKKQAHPVVLNSLLFLASRGRLAELPFICEHMETLHCERHAILRARIDTAAPLDEDQLGAIRERLEKRFGKTVEAATQVDPTLLGGFKVHVGDSVLDFSIRTQLQRLRKSMINA